MFYCMGVRPLYYTAANERNLPPEQVERRTKQSYRARDSLAFVGPREPDYVREALGARFGTADGLFNPTMVRKTLFAAQIQEVGSATDRHAIPLLDVRAAWAAASSDELSSNSA
jgi:hypothetical protein